MGSESIHFWFIHDISTAEGPRKFKNTQQLQNRPNNDPCLLV